MTIGYNKIGGNFQHIDKIEPMSYIQFNDTTFPAISVNKFDTANNGVSSQQVFPRYAQFTYQVNAVPVSGNISVDQSGVESRLDTSNDLATHTNDILGALSANDYATETKQATLIKRSFSGVESTDVRYVAVTGNTTYTFHGVQVLKSATLSADFAPSNGAGSTIPAGTVLQPGYHPVAGTSISFSDIGQVYLVGA